MDRRSVLAGAAMLAGSGLDRAVADGIAGPDLVELAPTQGILRAQIAPGAGGEMAGLQCKVGDSFRELLYRGRDFRPVEGWTGKAPILWPGVGRNAVALPGETKSQPGWIWKGKRYPMHGHGFAREQKWRLEKLFSGHQTAYAVVSTADTPATRAMYPFGFALAAEYRVVNASVILSFRVGAAKSNAGPMPFSIGNHITFNLPFAPAGVSSQIAISSSAKRQVLLGPDNTPTGQVVDVDYLHPRPLASLAVRTPVSLAGCPLGDVWTRLEDPAGMAITVSHQGDWRPDGEPVLFNLWGDVPQGFFAPEPWLGKQNSLATGDGVIVLPPGEDFHWRIAVDISFFGPLARS
jgi:galactose mutarotase-like enzyme